MCTVLSWEGARGLAPRVRRTENPSNLTNSGVKRAITTIRARRRRCFRSWPAAEKLTFMVERFSKLPKNRSATVQTPARSRTHLEFP